MTAAAGTSEDADPAGVRRGRRPRGGLRLFASPSEEPRARRPTDVVLLVLDVVVLGAILLVGRLAPEADDLARRLVAQLPGLLEGLWQVLHDLGAVWAVGLLLLAVLAHRRLSLARDLVLAAAVAALAAALTHRVVEGAWPSLLDELAASDGPARFPALRLSIAAGVTITASPHLARTLRYAGRWVIAGSAVATIALGVASPGGSLGALVLGSIAGATVHLVMGSPGGRPSLAQVERALGDLGVTVTDLRVADLQPEGVWTMTAVGPAAEPLIVKAYGRDAWDGQLAVSAWRHLWYRNTEAPFSFTRVQQVEHEAFLTLRASGAGVRVPAVRAVGRSLEDDALLVLSTDAVPLDAVVDPSDALIADLWSSLLRAHEAGISPAALDPTRLGCDGLGRGVLLDWVTGVAAPTPEQRLTDAGQLVVSIALVVGDERAIAAAESALGCDRLGELLPYLQPASLSPHLRRLARDQDYDVEALRKLTAKRLGREVPSLVHLRRVTFGSVAQAVLLLVAATALVNGLTSLDFASVSDELFAMSGALLVVAFVLAQLARASGALSTLGASPEPLPVAPLVQLQFAISYINMAVPSSAGRLAMVTRFYQRVGSTAATALGVGALDGVSNLIVQILVIVGTVVFGIGTLDIDLAGRVAGLPSDTVDVVVVIGGILVLAAALALLLPSVRSKLLPPLRQLRDGFRVLRSPSKLALLFGGNLLSQAAFALALGACVQATGHHVGLADLMVINALVGTFAAVIPVPNGIGVSEAGLTAGLVAAGVPETTAFAAAITYRVLSTYLPPVWGFFAMGSLQRQHYL